MQATRVSPLAASYLELTPWSVAVMSSHPRSTHIYQPPGVSPVTKVCSICVRLLCLGWLGGVVVSVSDSRSRGLGFDSRPGINSRQVVKTHVTVYLCHQAVYNFVPAKGRWCSAAGKVTVGLASHWLCGTDFSSLSTYGLNGHGKGNERPTYALLGPGPLLLCLVIGCVLSQNLTNVDRSTCRSIRAKCSAFFNQIWSAPTHLRKIWQPRPSVSVY